MPLHDWDGRPGWEGLRHLWITELLRRVKPRLPEGYRAYIGTAPLLAVGAPGERPDADEPGPAPAGPAPAPASAPPVEPDEEVAVATLEPEAGVFVERRGRLVAAVELISPRNKDRPVTRAAYLARYLGYLLDGAHLVLVDVHRRPAGFSFPDRIAAELHLSQPPSPASTAVSYRVGEPAPGGGRLLAIWRRPLTPGAPLPTLPLPLNPAQSVELALEPTYSRAAEDAYLP